MKVKVEKCWNGGDKFSFRVSLPDGSRETFGGETWTRSLAARVLDVLERLYGYNRRTIRFDVA